MKKKIKLVLIPFVLSFIVFLGLYFFVSQENIFPYSDSVFIRIPEILAFFISIFFALFLIIYLALAIFNFLYFKLKKIKNESKTKAFFASIIINLFFCFLGFVIANYISQSFFPNAHMRANMLKIKGDITKEDIKKIKKLVPGKLLNISEYSIFCNKDNADILCDKLSKNEFLPKDIIVTNGYNGHWSEGKIYLLRKIDTEWKILKEDDYLIIR